MFLKNKEVIKQLAKRDIQQKYRSSYLGFIWTILTPLFMLIIYTFVFSYIFKSKWGTGVSTNHLEFALSLFCGLIMFNIFSETVGRAPGLIVSNPNYVKKVVFPIEILPISSFLSALFQAGINLIILLVFLLFSTGKLYLTIFYLPFILIPLFFLTLGLSWFLASLGVFIRDINQSINIIINMLFYLTPIFYPVTVVPKGFQNVMKINPLTPIVENTREVILWGHAPNWGSLGIAYILNFIVFVLGYLWFKKTRKGFADVI